MRLYFASRLYSYLVSWCLRWGIWGSGRSDQSFCPNTDIFFPPAPFPSFDRLNNQSIHHLSLILSILSLSPVIAGWYRITPCIWRLGVARARLPVKSPASRCDRCSASTQHPPDLAWSSTDLCASTSWLPQAGTKRQPGRRTSGRCKLSSGALAPLSHPLGPGDWYVTTGGSPKILGEGPGLGAPAPAACPGCRSRRAAPLASRITQTM